MCESQLLFIWFCQELVCYGNRRHLLILGLSAAQLWFLNVLTENKIESCKRSFFVVLNKCLIWSRVLWNFSSFVWSLRCSAVSSKLFRWKHHISQPVWIVRRNNSPNKNANKQKYKRMETKLPKFPLNFAKQVISSRIVGGFPGEIIVQVQYKHEYWKLWNCELLTGVVSLFQFYFDTDKMRMMGHGV